MKFSELAGGQHFYFPNEGDLMAIETLGIYFFKVYRKEGNPDSLCLKGTTAFQLITEKKINVKENTEVIGIYW